MVKLIVCSNCGKYTKHRARGLCGSCYDQIYAKKRIKHYYQEHKEHIKKQNCKRLVERKIERLKIICDSYNRPLQCMHEGCTITNPLLLSVRHVNGRSPKEFSVNKYYNRGSYKRGLPQIERIAIHVFQENVRTKNYMIFCQNHGRIYEWGTIAQRIAIGTRGMKEKIKRYVHRLFLLGGKCAICGEKDYNFLIGHHKNNNGVHDKGLMVMNEHRFRELYEANELQCICINCHDLLHYREWKEVVNLLDYCIT